MIASLSLPQLQQEESWGRSGLDTRLQESGTSGGAPRRREAKPTPHEHAISWESSVASGPLRSSVSDTAWSRRGLGFVLISELPTPRSSSTCLGVRVPEGGCATMRVGSEAGRGSKARCCCLMTAMSTRSGIDAPRRGWSCKSSWDTPPCGSKGRCRWSRKSNSCLAACGGLAGRRV